MKLYNSSYYVNGLLRCMKLNNKYYILRHGEAVSNIKQITSSWPEKFENPLTERGIEMIKESAEKLMDKNIDLIFSSDLLRTKQTAEIVSKALKIEPEFDKRLREVNFGIFNSKPITNLDIYFKKEEERIFRNMPKGETYKKVLERIYDFLKDTDKKYKGRNILIISHECPLWILESKVRGTSLLQYLTEVPRDDRIHKGQIKELN